MLKWMGAGLGVITAVWMVIQREHLAVFPLCAGAALTAALFAVLNPMQGKVVVPPIEDTAQQIELVKREATRALDTVKLEMQRLEQKLSKADERTLSYQKLVDVHHNEIAGLREENQALADVLAQKEKQLMALHFARQEPDLFNP